MENRLERSRDAGVVVLAPVGLGDPHVVEGLDAALSELAPGAASRVLVDFALCASLDRRGWAVLATQSRRLVRAGGRFAVCGMAQTVEAGYRLLDPADPIEAFADRASALATIAGPGASVAASAPLVPARRGTVEVVSRPAAGSPPLLVLEVHGSVDSFTATTLEKLLEPFLARAQLLVATFASVDYISSAGWGTLLLAAGTLRRKGGLFAICDLNPAMRSSFQFMQIDFLVSAYADEPAAVAALRGARPGG